MERIAIVGAGLSGLSAAYHLVNKGFEGEIDLIEEGQPGGKVHSENYEGAILEHGPETYFVRSPLVAKLSRDLGIAGDLLPASKSSNMRFLAKEGSLEKLPSGPLSFLFSSLIFFPQKIALLRGVRKKLGLWEELSMFEVARMLFGETIAETFASPFSRGVYGCEAEDLEFAAAFPQIYERLSRGESLMKSIKGVAEARREYWSSELGEESVQSMTKGIHSFRGGLQQLTDALYKEISGYEKVHRIEASVKGIERSGEQYVLKGNKALPGKYNKILFTVQAERLSHIFSDLNGELTEKLSQMHYSPVNIVFQSWKKSEFSPNGFGFLAPRKEKLPLLGTLYSSNIFPDRSRQDESVTKTIIAGDGNLFSDDELSDISARTIQKLHRTKANPVWQKVVRHTPGIPRYFKGYSSWKREVEQMLKSHPGIELAGWDFQGMGLPEALEGGYHYAKRVTSGN